jgi:hypothetical protein
MHHLTHSLMSLLKMEKINRWNGRQRMNMDGKGNVARAENETKRRNMTR